MELMMPLVVISVALAVAGDYDLQMSKIWLTVSSLKRVAPDGDVISQELQMNWSGDVEEVSLLTKEPTKHSLAYITVKTADHPSGMYQTPNTIEGQHLPGGWQLDHPGDPDPRAKCFPFWIVSFQNVTPILAECLEIRPTWMGDISHKLENLPLTSVLWPGTHNSGCYPAGLKLSPTLGRFVFTQDMDVWSQLVFGVRYIDLRVGIYPVKNNGTPRVDFENSFWVNHDLIKVRPLLPILREIKQFLLKAKKEIVILDFHRFPVGFSGRHHRHNRLVELLERELMDVAVEFNGTWPTFKELWAQGKQLIIAYGDNEVAKKHPWLWPPVRQQWGNRQTVAGLQEFLECCMNDTELRAPERGFWAAMAQLTPGPSDLLFKPHQSLRSMAESVNPHLSTWLRDRWWSQASIITSDFFLGNRVVDLAIAANSKKGTDLLADMELVDSTLRPEPTGFDACNN